MVEKNRMERRERRERRRRVRRKNMLGDMQKKMWNKVMMLSVVAFHIRQNSPGD